jgi:hypothetical protein
VEWPETNAAFWSAVAAWCAAVSSLLIMRIQRRSLLESVRPELILGGWARQAHPSGNESIKFSTVRNIGRGPALRVHAGLFKEADNFPVAALADVRIAILGTGETENVDGEILVWWSNVQRRHGDPKVLSLTVPITCLDSRGVRHETRYDLVVLETPQDAGASNAIAPGIWLMNRSNTATPAWWRKTTRGLKRALWS